MDFEQAQAAARTKKALHHVGLRQGCGKTVEDVATASGLTVAEVEEIERGDVEMPPQYFQTIGMMCDCDENHQG